ncbi:maleylpyruvate isomerase family mycothiol-dependent enzyme [soil metagenome]
MDTTTAHAETRGRITAILRQLSDAEADHTVPACPAWSVQQLASHVVGVSADILAGNLDDAGSDPWTEAQVNARAGRRLAELADEWDEIGPQVESALADGALPAQAVFDQVTHEHDLRSAVGRPGAQSHPAVPIGLSFVVDAWPFVASSLDVPPLRIVAGDATMVVGDNPEVTLMLGPFEALRALTGRRSTGQVRAYEWGTDPTPWLPAFTWGPFVPVPHDLIEPPTP